MADTATTLAVAQTADGDFRRTLGSRMTLARKTRGWKQRELARRAQVDPGRLSKLERGVVRASLDELIRLSLALGAGLDELVFGASPSLEAKRQRLFQELERVGGPEAIDFTSRLLQALVLCFGAGPAPEAE